MHGRLAVGTKVETIQPEVESKDWQPEALARRVWGVSGRIVELSDGHGLTYKVAHDKGGEAHYEPRELKEIEAHTYTPEERAEMLRKMRACSDAFYSHVVRTGCHAMIEFTGLMNEFIKVCGDAHEAGEQFPFANTHSGITLPFKPWHLAYLAEKLSCIYGPSLLESEEARDAFIRELFGGEFKLVSAVEQAL